MNKKYKGLIISLMVLLTIIISLPMEGYNAKAKPNLNSIKVATKEVKTDNEAFTSTLKIPVISGIDNKEVQIGINKTFEKDALSFKNNLEKDAKEALDSYKKLNIGIFHKYEADTTYQVRLNKDCILSITVMYYQYTGGAHGMEVQKGYNFDLKTGELLQLSDLFERGFNYKQVINTEVTDYINAHKDSFFYDSAASFKGISDNQPFYLGEGNLIVYFGEYEIAPYAAGIPEFKISYSKLKLKKDLRL